ncbi:MAG: hypothetical protein JWL95_648 [Gemmatimonadetes bacterium]|nr:hypothetical protein [Gemmatimonadota bacterium]
MEPSRGVPPTTGAEPRGTVVRPWMGLARAQRALLLVALPASLFACHGDRAPSDPVSRISAPDDASDIDEAELPGAIAIAPTLLDVTTYEGSGQLVHPDATFFPRSWQGHRYWLSATPYPGGDPRFENPSIFYGSTSKEMLVPTGVSNPLALPETQAYLSDPDLVFDPEAGELRMYYRQTLPYLDQLFVATSRNGQQWTKGRRVISDSRYALISPAIVREGPGAWRMWTVNAVPAGCQSTIAQISLQQRRSTDGVTWAEPEPVQLSIAGRVPWHWDVQYVAAKSEYWAMIAAYPQGTSCSQSSVYFARSLDGTTWNVSPVPLLAAGAFQPLRDLVYRSTFHYHDGSDVVSVWFSGARLEGNLFRYAIASARYPMEELLRRVSGASAATLERGQSERPSAELESARAKFIEEFP